MDPTTLQSTVMQLLNQLAPGLGPQIYMGLSMYYPQLQDKFMTTPLWYQGTATGLYERSLMNSISTATFRTMRPAMFREREDFFKGINQLLHPYVESEYSSRAAYDTIMRSDAMGMSNNPLWMMLYQSLDPTGTAAGFQALNQAGSNLIRNAYAGGNRQAFGLANVAARMFTDKDGHFRFDRRDFGSMGFDEVAQVTAALTKNIYLDPSAGAPENVAKASEELTKKVQEYTKALAPLKDVFGKDVPAMIKSIEELTDQSLGNLDPTILRNRVNNAMSGVLTGSYSLGELVDTTKEIYGALGQMNVPGINDFGAEEQAATILGINNSGYSPATMKNTRFRKAVQQHVLRTSNSRGAEYANYAYAAWKELEGNADKTAQDFLDQYRALTTGPNAISSTDAFLQLSRTVNLQQLENMGTGSSWYMDAVSQDVGGRVARASELNRARDNYITSGNFGSMELRSRIWDMIMKDSSLLTKTDAELRRMGIAEEDRAGIYNFRNSSNEFTSTARQRAAEYFSEERATERRSRVRNYQNLLDTMTDWKPVSQDPREFAMRFFGLQGREAESIKQIFGSGLAPLSADDQTYLEDSIRMYNLAAGKDIVLTNKDYTEFIRNMSTSDNATFAHYRELYNKATNDEDRLAYSQMAMLSTVYDTDTLEKYFKGFKPGEAAFRERVAKLHGLVFDPRKRFEEGLDKFKESLGDNEWYDTMMKVYKASGSMNDAYDTIQAMEAPAGLNEKQLENWNAKKNRVLGYMEQARSAATSEGNKLIHRQFALTALDQDSNKKERVVNEGLYQQLREAISNDGVEAGLELLNDTTKMQSFDSKDVEAAKAFIKGVDGVSGAYGGQGDVMSLIPQLINSITTLVTEIGKLLGQGGNSSLVQKHVQTTQTASRKPDPSDGGQVTGAFGF